VAGSRPLGAAVGLYGGGIVTGRTEAMGPLLDLLPTMTTPWLGLFGDADSSIPTDDVERLRAELADHGSVDAEVVRYPDAEHGFHCDARLIPGGRGRRRLEPHSGVARGPPGPSTPLTPAGQLSAGAYGQLSAGS